MQAEYEEGEVEDKGRGKPRVAVLSVCSNSSNSLGRAAQGTQNTRRAKKGVRDRGVLLVKAEGTLGIRNR